MAYSDSNHQRNVKLTPDGMNWLKEAMNATGKTKEQLSEITDMPALNKL